MTGFWHVACRIQEMPTSILGAISHVAIFPSIYKYSNVGCQKYSRIQGSTSWAIRRPYGMGMACMQPSAAINVILLVIIYGF